MSQLVFGIHAVTAALNNTRIELIELLIADSRRDAKMTTILALAAQRKVAIKQTNRRDLDQLLPDVNHQGLAMRVRYSEQQYTEADVQKWIEEATSPTLFLILDGVQDPHNLGACLRTADAAGVTAVIAPKDKASSLTPAVRKVACGAAETVPFIQVTNLARFLKQIQQAGVWCYGLAGEATKTVFDIDWSGHVAVVLGAEGNGLRQLTRETCDDLVAIPLCGSVSSLNVSVATGVSLFEVVRQRNKK